MIRTKQQEITTKDQKTKLVTVTYIKTKGHEKAKVIEAGPQASLIRFEHNGMEQCISNKFLK